MKKILKKIFPLIFLRKLGLVFNKLLLKIYYPIFFPYYNNDSVEIIINKSKNPFLDLFTKEDFSTSEQNDFSLWLHEKWYQNSYIVKFKKRHRIEPLYGWALVYNKLITFSLGFYHVPYLRRPNLVKTYSNYSNKKINKAVSFRDTGEYNYFHFFNDVLLKYYFLKNNITDLEEYQFIVSKKLYEREYFQYFLKNTSVGKYNWILQDVNDYIEVKEAIYCKPYTHDIKLYKELLSELNISPKGNRKIYITRPSSSLRFISNETELTLILLENGFEIIDPSELNFEQQISVFSQADWIIGVHGAGLSNMIFRAGAPLNVIEIFSPYIGFNPFHYIMMAKMFQFNYKYINGIENKDKVRGGFNVDVYKLEQLLNSFNEA